MLATGDVEHPGDKKTASRPSLNTPLQSPACIQHLSESLFRKTPLMIEFPRHHFLNTKPPKIT